ncbi:ABC transporter ATP-binding protein [Streptosporangium sp. NPDC048865]|uniref:ABC transporter ATP-binding protein n=1 Tax=Streptosporangium sp. NPDC048865 TaxID=3155766 RepID=UPI00342DB9C0
MPEPRTGGHHLEAVGVSVGYSAAAPVLTATDLSIPPGRVTALIGSNGSGKSTLLRTLARALEPLAGQVLLDGADIARMPRRHLARALSILPQSPAAPEGLTVRDLCRFGRHPHRGFLSRETEEDRRAVEAAIGAAHLEELADRDLDELSGGQRQRAWIALCLAQDSPVMLLDEPTTYLDIAHQIEVLDLLRELNHTAGTTVVMVLHDLNQAAQYADHVVAVADRRVHAAGPPAEVLTPETVRAVFGIDSVVVAHPVTGSPLCLPLSRPGRSPAGQAGDLIG